MRHTVERILGGPLDDPSWTQATLGVPDGGLGFRRSRDVALPAFIASRVEARWLLELLTSSLQASAFFDYDLMEWLDETTNAAVSHLLSTMSDTGAMQAEALLEEVGVRSGTARPTRTTSSGQHGALRGDGLVLPAGGEDFERDSEEHVQTRLCRIVDNDRAASLLEHLQTHGPESSARCLRELRDPSTSHDWLWSLNPCHGPIVPKEEFLFAVRLRIGAPIMDEPMMCQRCGTAILDRAGRHCLLCATPEATRGHFAVRDAVLHLAHLADHVPRLRRSS